MKVPENSDQEPLLIEHKTPKSSATTRRQQYLTKRELKLSQQEKWGRKRLGIVTICVCLIIYFSCISGISPPVHQMVVSIPPDDANLPSPKEITPISNESTTINNTTYAVPKGYLVAGPKCQIIDLDPLAKDVMRLFTKEEFEPCASKEPLTSIIQNYDNKTVTLYFNHTLKSKYMTSGCKFMECCFQSIKRAGTKDKADKNFELSDCKYFSSSVELPPHMTAVLVKCKCGITAHAKTKKTVYTNAHAFVRENQTIRKELDKFKDRDTKRPLSVLMLGIDSISRLNLIRSMPHLAQHLYDTGWFELKGYNKIDDNTYPNLMAILTGFNNTLAYGICDPKKVGQLDTCPFLWRYFHDNGYVTGYAEDEASINTFNYHKLGFLKQPTDFYMRPFAIAAEKYLTKKYKNSLTFCLGYQNYADHIYQYALDFASVYKNDSYFGLFWTNTFSHNDISDPSSMDLRMKFYIEELERREILKNNMVIFFSDHGLRFGPVRSILTGWLEERLPFIFIWLPEWFKNEHPEIVQALKINRNRLTNPYDLHMTLKHVLELSGRIENLSSAVSCPACQSIFTEMPWNRSCDDAMIASHWCTCANYQPIDKSSKIVKEAVNFVINYINDDLNAHQNSTKICAKLKLKSITLAKIAKYPEAKNPYNDYLLIFDGVPGAGRFESTARHFINSNSFEVTGSISRLNEYASQSECMHIDYLRKYCYCLKRKFFG